MTTHELEYHLYLYDPPKNLPLSVTVNSVEAAINCHSWFIYTTQVVTCTTRLFKEGYRIFVHDKPRSQYEIKLGNNERTTRQIRMGHNLYKLILAGEFDLEG